VKIGSTKLIPILVESLRRIPNFEPGTKQRHGISGDVPVMLLLNEVISSSESDKMCVVSRRWDGDAASTAYVRVTELVRQHLYIICTEVVVVPQHVIV